MRGKVPITEVTAKAIHDAFPRYSIPWLMGFDEEALRENPEMTISEYQTLARRTQNKALKWHDAKEHALCGLAAEVGEIHALHQKAHQGHPLLLSNLQEE